MTWIRVDTGLTRHPKVRVVAQSLGFRRNEVVGLLISLWAYALEYHEDGDLSSAAWPCVAEDLGYPRSRGNAIRDALTQAGFLTADSRLNDWEEYQGALLTRRSLDRNRKAEQRRKAKERAAEVGEMSTGRPADVLRTSRGRPDRTNETNETKSIPHTSGDADTPAPKAPSWPADVAAALSLVGPVTPGRAGKALADFARTNPHVQQHGLGMLALAAASYAKHVTGLPREKIGFVKHPAEFFARAGYWVDQVRPGGAAELVERSA